MKEIKGKALGKFILIKPEEVGESKTETGIILPAGKKVSNRGVVISIGGGIVDPGFKEGDTILFSSYSKDSLNIDGEDYLLMPIDDAKFVI